MSVQFFCLYETKQHQFSTRATPQHASAGRLAFQVIQLFGYAGRFQRGDATPEMIALSEFAVAVLPFPVKDYRTKLTDRSRDAFRELAAAGIMEPVPGRDGDPEADYCFTEGRNRLAQNTLSRHATDHERCKRDGHQWVFGHCGLPERRESRHF